MSDIEDFQEMQKKYLEDLTSNSESVGKNERIFEKALACALEIRKFEINLYWKRAAYFWAFITAIFTAYFTVLSNDLLMLEFHSYLVLGVAIVGYIFSFSWYLVNRGSKFWQKNWEMHVDFLEDAIMGSLYKTVKHPLCYKKIKILSGYPSSVSKINQLLSLVVSSVWIILIYYSFAKITPLVWYLIVIITFAIIGVSYLIFRFTRSSIERSKDGKPYIIRVPKKENKTKK